MNATGDRQIDRALTEWCKACDGNPEKGSADVVLREQDIEEALKNYGRRWARENGYVKP